VLASIPEALRERATIVPVGRGDVG